MAMGDEQIRPKRANVFAGWPAAFGSLAILGGVVYAAPSAWAISPLLAMTNGLVSLTFLATALLLAGHPDQQENARLFGVTALFWTAGYLGASQRISYDGAPQGGPGAVIQWIAGPLCFSALAAVLLRYPEARLQRIERVYVSTAAVLVVALRAFSVTVSEPIWHGFVPWAYWPNITASRVLSQAADALFAAAVVVLAVAFGALLVRRFHRAKGIDRPLLRPVIITAIAIGVIVGSEVVSETLPGRPGFMNVVFIVESSALLAIPVAFLVATIRQRLSHAAVAGLVLQLSRPLTTTAAVRDSLRRILNDPGLDVAYWLPEYGAFFAAEGRRSPDVAPTAEKLTKYVNTIENEPLARITVDSSLKRHSTLVDAAITAVGFALENGQLHAELHTQVAEARKSRERLIIAADAERRRLERNLHDGAQQRLLALKLELAAARTETQSAHELALIDRARAELQETLEELRELASGTHPTVLSEAGLAAAIGRVAARLPIHVDIRIPSTRWAPSVEVTLYFVACECLSNVVKHAKAQEVSVVIRERTVRLDLEISDDGVGGARMSVGGGLFGLRDRVDAMGGELTLVSPLGAGTRVVASVPNE